MKLFSLIVNYKNKNSHALAENIIKRLRREQINLLLPPDRPGFSTHDKTPIDLSGVDMLIVLGGDGTILASSKLLAGQDTPIFAINMGQVGFLSEVEPDEAMDALEVLIRGEYYIEKRIKLNGNVIRNGQIIESQHSLNDFIISNNIFSRTIMFDVFCNNQQVSDYRADGIIIATPTGSTAYSLSAGGPIATPSMDFMIITPVCTHGFFSRPLIVPSDAVVDIFYRSKSGTGNFVCDGQNHFLLEQNDLIRIVRSEQTANFVRFNDYSFFKTVKSKLLKGKM